MKWSAEPSVTGRDRRVDLQETIVGTIRDQYGGSHHGTLLIVVVVTKVAAGSYTVESQSTEIEQADGNLLLETDAKNGEFVEGRPALHKKTHSSRAFGRDWVIVPSSLAGGLQLFLVAFGAGKTVVRISGQVRQCRHRNLHWLGTRK